MKTIATLTIGVVTSLLLIETSLAGTWIVSSNGKADFNNIQGAINAASDGDEILVYPGTYTSTGDEVVNTAGKAIWLHSSDGPEVTIISGENARRCMLISSGESTSTLIEGFTLTNGNKTASSGGGLGCYSSSPTITNCVFTNNYAGWGGGAEINSDVLLTDCSFVNNTARHDGGGMYINSGSPVLTNCSFIGNSTEQHYGGGVRTSDSTPSFVGCTFENNHGDRWGGAVMNGGTSVSTFSNCTFSGNSCGDWLGYDEAGGIYNQADGGGASSIISNSVFCENSPTHITGQWTDNGDNCQSDACDDCIDIDADCDNDGISDPQEIANGSSDYNQNNVPDECECLADVNGDGSVNTTDILMVIASWGQPGPLGDVNFSGAVDVIDLLDIVDNWGECPDFDSGPVEGAVQWRVEDGGNGHWYYLLELSPSQSAEHHFAIAESMGGHTVTFASAEENQFCFNLTNNGSPPLNAPLIGVRKEAGTNQGAWVTGESWGYTNWHSGEGNNSWERYANMWVNDNQTSQWQDTDLTPHAYSIVEWPE
ncbi:MAG: hypothetical protein HOC27_05445 [Phycisphaerae bacterium]|nr:hypothetical protein [Phycisphaerae bacterium]